VSYRACIKVARGFDPALVVGPVRGDGTMYSGLQFLPGRTSVPLVVNHDLAKRVGTVHELVRLDLSDGWWVVARGTVDAPPEWLRRDTGASFCSRKLRAYEINGWTHVSHALVDEVTTVGPGFRAVDPYAKVMFLDRVDEASPEVTRRATRAAPTTGGQVIHHPPGAMLRRYFETTITIR